MLLPRPEYEVEGILYEVLELITVGRARRPRQKFILLSATAEPQYIPLEAEGELVERLRHLPLKVRLRVRFYVEGRLWYPPQGTPRYHLRLVALELTPLPAF
ncbi:MAG: hypothetical protein NZ958_08500 [Bacteroidia bacterium]|nr:hypothetical protein [Bacteroidia bacterium]MDW8088479.1 hypothetical protein [Bacteroidia bacterium]